MARVWAIKKSRLTAGLNYFGGERGIRTPGTLAGTTVFKTAAFDHSAISPGAKVDSFFNFSNTLKKKMNFICVLFVFISFFSII